MQCTNCQTEASAAAIFCRACGHLLALEAQCHRCRASLSVDANFCEACGLRRVANEQDDSFLEPAFKSCLNFIRVRGFGFTHTFMRLPARLLGMEENNWAAEEVAYLFALCLTFALLALASEALHRVPFAAWFLVVYVAYRLLDILSYELEIVFMDRHQNVANRGGHLLSVDRRVLCAFLHLLDFIGCYALLFLAIANLQADAFLEPGIKSTIEALYFSVIVATFTGLSSVTPASAAARLAVMSEIVLNLVFFSILFATVVGSLGQLTEMTPRPPRASRIFRRRNIPADEAKSDD